MASRLLLMSFLLCISSRESLCQRMPSCAVKIYAEEVDAALDTLDIGKLSEPTPDGMDAFFRALRDNRDTELVILMDTSLEVRPNRFYLINKPLLDSLFKYHLDSEKVSMSLITFGENDMQIQCQEVIGSCDGLRECLRQVSYSSNHVHGWVESSLVQALDATHTILKQPSKTNREKIVLILSGFRIWAEYFPHILDKKQMLATDLGVYIYTVRSSFRNRVIEAESLATTSDKYMVDTEFVRKMFSIVPLKERSCAGEILPQENKDNKICKPQPGQPDDIPACVCKFGYDGQDCEQMPRYCDEFTACPLGSSCTVISGAQYNCACPSCTTRNACLNFGNTFNRPPAPFPTQFPPDRVPPPAPRDRVPFPPPAPRDRVPVPFPAPVPVPRPQPRPQPTSMPPRDIPLRTPAPPPPRDPPPPPRNIPNPPRNVPNRDLAPDSLSTDNIPPDEVMVYYLTVLLEKFRNIIYPNANPVDNNRRL